MIIPFICSGMPILLEMNKVSDLKILIATFFKPERKSLMLKFKDQIKNIEENSEHV